MDSVTQKSRPEKGFAERFTAVVTFRRMEAVSLCHSAVYLALLVCAFGFDKPEPFTFIFGLTHGLLWIAMSLTCIFAVRYRVINLRLAVAIVLLGCIAPFFGSLEFLRQNHQRRVAAA